MLAGLRERAGRLGHLARSKLKLPKLRVRGDSDASAPPPPWPIRLRMICAEAGTIVGVFLVALVATAVLFANPRGATPTITVGFAGGQTGVERAGEGETGAHSDPLAIEPAFAPYIEAGPYGPLPKIAANGEKPAKRFARPVTPSDAGSIVSVVVSGLGLNDEETRDAITASAARDHARLQPLCAQSARSHRARTTRPATNF